MDYFKEHRTGIFLNRQTLPTYLGLSSLPKGNLGIVDNSGFEFQLEWNQQVNDLVSFTLRGNASWNRDKIIENDEAPKPYPWMENEALMCSHNGVLLLMACLLVKKKLKSMPHSLVKYT